VHRVEQFFSHLTARVGPDDAERARRILPASAWPLFASMPTADQRHGLDVAHRLLAAGHEDPDLLAAALLHDAAKGDRMRLWHRVAGVSLEALAPRLLERLGSDDAAWWRRPFHLYLHHAGLSADAARAAGCSERTAAFIVGRAAPPDARLEAAFRAADESS
jgi:hypothetical protein